MNDKLNEREPAFALRYAREVARLALVRRDPGALLWSVLAVPRYEGGGRYDSKALYFVNTSDEVLRAVRASQAGLFRYGDTQYGQTTSATTCYADVQPQEGVMVDSWHPMADGDFILQCEIEVSAADGEQGFRLTGRGEFRSSALYFADGVRRHAVPKEARR